MIEIEAYRFSQGKKVMFFIALPVKDIFEKFNLGVDLWKEGHNEGYQREISKSRANSFKRYIAKTGGFCPVSATLNFRDKIKFKPEKDNFGKLIFPEKPKIWIVDGQHRLEGIKAGLDEYPEIFWNLQVPMVLMNEEDVYNEAAQFYIINKTQKGVRPDLAQRLLVQVKEEGKIPIEELPSKITKGVEWVPAAIKITDNLNNREGSVWFKKIKLPNTKNPNWIITQKSFADSLEPLIDKGILSSYEPDEIAEILDLFWRVIKEIYPSAFTDPKDYVIQKTTGVFVLHKLFQDILGYSIYDGKLKKEKLVQILKNMDPVFNGNYWASRGYAGQKGTNKKSFALFYQELRDILNRGNQKRERRRLFELE